MEMQYNAKYIGKAPAMDLDWDSWKDAETVELTHLRQESSDHRPVVFARLFHDKTHIYGIYKVEDRFVKVTHVGYQQSVCRDSCVEFFFKPSVGPGYFNLEMNAGGSFLFYYVRNNHQLGETYLDFSEVDERYGSLVQVKGSMPTRVEPEIGTPVTWFAQFSLPIEALEHYCGRIGSLNGQQWTCNFYKCADECSHPHWLSWAPVPLRNFHLPECFKPLHFL